MKILFRVLKIIKWGLISLAGLLICLFIVIMISRGVNQSKFKITGENSISESSYILIGGVEQFIQIRGKNKNNPVILFLHGGPGQTMPYISYYFQQYLINNFTFVSWDQRGSGRTYYRNQSENYNITMDILMQNLDELVQYLKQRFEQEQIIIMGHSWGTVLGIEYIKYYSENVSNYIGIGQAINNESDLFLGRKAIEIAIEKNNTNDIAELEKLLNEYEPSNMDNYFNLRQLISKYLGAENKTYFKLFWKSFTSPDLEFIDLKWFMNTMTSYDMVFTMFSSLLDFLFEFNAYDFLTENNVSMAFITGSDDWITPMEMARDYYNVLENENKRFIAMEGIGHFPFINNPKLFSDIVLDILKN